MKSSSSCSKTASSSWVIGKTVYRVITEFFEGSGGGAVCAAGGRGSGFILARESLPGAILAVAFVIEM